MDEERLKKEIKIINSLGEGTFFIDSVGDKTGQSYKGKFVVKCALSAMDVIQADALYRDLIGPTNPVLAQEGPQSLAFALSQLRYRIIEAPPFWKAEKSHIDGGDIADNNIILEVLNMAFLAEEKYKEILAKEDERNEEEIKEELENTVFTEEETVMIEDEKDQ